MIDSFTPPIRSKDHEVFHELAKYLFTFGVNRSNVRIKMYTEFLADAAGKSKYSPEDAAKLWREIHEIMFVLQTFKINNFTPPTDLIVAAFNGKPLEEYTNESGRNLFLQLRASIYFLKLGYGIGLDHDCDVVAVNKRRKEMIFVECKRIYSEKKGRERTDEAIQQLTKRLNNADKRIKSSGVIWLDPSPAMQKHFFMYTAYSRIGVASAARMDLTHFWRQWVGDRFERIDQRILGSVLQMVWPSWVGGEPIITTGFTSYVALNYKANIFDRFYAKSTFDRLFRIEE